MLLSGVGVVTFKPVLLRDGDILAACFGGGPGLKVKQIREIIK